MHPGRAWLLVPALLVTVAPRVRAMDQAAVEVVAWPQIPAVEALAAGPDGFLWLGTPQGLLRFDGLVFSAKGPSAPKPSVRKLMVGVGGEIWAATGVGTLEHAGAGGFDLGWREGEGTLLRGRNGVFAAVHAGVSRRDWLYALSPDSGGGLWLGDEYGLRRWHEGVGFTRPAWAAPLDGRLVAALHRAADGRLWIGSAGGLAVLDEGRLAQDPDRTAVLELAGDGRGRVWAGRRDGVLEVDGPARRLLPTPAPVTALLCDRGGTLWVGTTRGLLRLAGRQLETARQRALVDVAVSALAQDADGTVWVGARTSPGLLALKPRRVTNWGTEEGLEGAVAFAVLPARDGGAWATTAAGLARIQDGGVKMLRSGRDIPATGLRSLAATPDGALLIGAEQGLVRGREGSFDLVRTPEPPLALLVARGDLWVTWKAGGVTRFPGGRLEVAGERFGPAHGLCPGPMESPASGPTGTIWLAGGAGLSRLAGGAGRCFPARAALAADRVLAAHEDGRGSVWIGRVSGGGLGRLRDGTVADIPEAAGLPSPYVLGFADDGRGHLWMSSTRGLYRLSLAEMDGVADRRAPLLMPLLYQREDGLRSEHAMHGHGPALALDGAGTIWAATRAGVVAIDVSDRDARRVSGHRPAPVLDEILADGRPGRLDHPVVIGPGVRHLEVRYSVPSLDRPRRLHVAHRLQGLDRAWIPAPDHRAAHYTALAPGDYRFEVRVIDPLGDGTAKDARTAVLAVTVRPFLGQTWWFRAAAALLAAAGLAALYRGRLRRLEVRHAAVEGERARIARDLHDGLAQGFTALGLLLDGLRLAARDAAAPVPRIIAQARQTLDRTQEEARRALWDVRAVGGRPLEALVEDVIARARRGSATEILYTPPARPAPRSPEVQAELPRILEEALTNVARHAGAALVSVTLTVTDDALELVVQDDGRGLTAPAPDFVEQGRFGILGMRERARRLGGTLTLDPAEPGLTVRLRLPLAQGSPDAG